MSPAGPSLVTPALIIVPNSPGLPDHMDLVTTLVTVAVWAVMAWRKGPGRPPAP
ncbi:hypothetical protein [Streptomyces puniciscabiei]|uniref:hypothetical protein n=1 Tax=Streptomyces puniciscabiei TaxID=164348 RepID=UPI00331B98C3